MAAAGGIESERTWKYLHIQQQYGGRVMVSRSSCTNYKTLLHLLVWGRVCVCVSSKRQEVKGDDDDDDDGVCSIQKQMTMNDPPLCTALLLCCTFGIAPPNCTNGREPEAVGAAADEYLLEAASLGGCYPCSLPFSPCAIQPLQTASNMTPTIVWIKNETTKHTWKMFVRCKKCWFIERSTPSNVNRMSYEKKISCT